MNRNNLMAGAAVCITLAAFTVAPLHAEDIDALVAEVATVHDGRGESRVLFRPTPIPFDEYTVIERSTLRVPFSGASEGRRLPLRVCVVTGDWSQGGRWDTEFDPRLFALASADFGAGSGVATFDVTTLLKEVLEDGAPFEGFVLTGGVKGSAGIATSDAERFGSMEGAELSIHTTVFPSKRPARTPEEDDRQE